MRVMINTAGEDLMMNDTVRTADGIAASIEEIRDDGVALLLSSRGHIERPIHELVRVGPVAHGTRALGAVG